MGAAKAAPRAFKTEGDKGKNGSDLEQGSLEDVHGSGTQVEIGAIAMDKETGLVILGCDA